MAKNQTNAQSMNGFSFIQKKLNEGFVFKESANKGAPTNPEARAENIARAAEKFGAARITVTPEMFNNDGTCLKLVHPDGHHVNAVFVPFEQDLNPRQIKGFETRLNAQAEAVAARDMQFNRTREDFGADVIAAMVTRRGWKIAPSEGKQGGRLSGARRDTQTQATTMLAKKGVDVDERAFSNDMTSICLSIETDDGTKTVHVAWERTLTEDELRDIETAEGCSQGQGRGSQIDRTQENFGADVIAAMVTRHGWKIAPSGRTLSRGLSKKHRDNQTQATTMLAKQGVDVDERAFSNDMTSIRLSIETDDGTKTMHVAWGRPLSDDELTDIETAKERPQGQDRRSQMQRPGRGAKKTGDRGEQGESRKITKYRGKLKRQHKKRYRPDKITVGAPRKAKPPKPKKDQKAREANRTKKIGARGTDVVEVLLDLTAEHKGVLKKEWSIRAVDPKVAENNARRAEAERLEAQGVPIENIPHYEDRVEVAPLNRPAKANLAALKTLFSSLTEAGVANTGQAIILEHAWKTADGRPVSVAVPCIAASNTNNPDNGRVLSGKEMDSIQKRTGFDPRELLDDDEGDFVYEVAGADAGAGPGGL